MRKHYGSIGLEYPTLEDVVQNYAHEKFDVFNIKRDTFTRKGRKQYNKMVNFIYMLGRLTDADFDELDRIVDRMEEIIRYE